MVGFNKEYYDNIPDEFIIPFGTLDIKNHHKTRKTSKYSVGDKLIVLPPWDGRSWISFKEMMELHERGEVGEIISLERPFWILGESSIQHYETVVIKTQSETLKCHPNYYRLGYSLKK